MKNRIVTVLLAFMSASSACSSPEEGGPGGSAGGPSGGAGAAGGGSEGPCTPTTCEDSGWNCGTASDGCDGTLECGSCDAPEVCGGAGPKNVCNRIVKGVWRDISPPGSEPGDNHGFSAFAIDPTHRNVLYAGQCGNGVWKSSDWGVTWKKLGDPSQIGLPTTGYLDNPVFIEVDPDDSDHLYANDAGWCGSIETTGFWESFDGGKTWTMPEGFQDAAMLEGNTTDVGRFDVDRGDFKHILLSMRYTVDEQFGFLESRDGGKSFDLHPYPTEVPGGTKGLNFLHEPSLDIGNGDTWLVTTEGKGFWRTSNASESWKNVAPEISGVHGGVSGICYTKAGVLFYGGSPNPARSEDNGTTWKTIDSLYGYWQVIRTDGENLYTVAVGADVPLLTSPETDGMTWKETGKTFKANPLLTMDSVNRILYATGLAGVEVVNIGPVE